jgi:hypothetical protein
MLIPLGVQKQRRQMTTNFHAVAAEGLRAVHGVSDNGWAEELRGAWNRARIPNGASTMRGIVARTVDGKQVTLLNNHPPHN